MKNNGVRKKEREVNDRRLLQTGLDKSPVGFLAMADGGRPYVVPISFVRDGDLIFFHSALVGRKMDFITASPRVSFSVLVHSAYCMGSLDFNYFSIYIEGLARIVTDSEEKRRAFGLLIEKYEDSADGARNIADECLESSHIVCINICLMSGKENLRA